MVVAAEEGDLGIFLILGNDKRVSDCCYGGDYCGASGARLYDLVGASFCLLT